MATHLQQLTGGNVEGLEHCPTAYHFDFETHEEFGEFLRNPEPTLKRLGIPVPYVFSIYLERWDEAFSETEGWKNKALMADGMKGVCCTGGGDGGVKCHSHC